MQAVLDKIKIDNVKLFISKTNTLFFLKVP